MPTHLVVGRHPLDMAVSLYHQGDNIDRERLRELTGAASTDGVPPATNGVRQQRPAVHEWLLAWIAAAPDPRTSLDSLPGVLYHLTDAELAGYHARVASLAPTELTTWLHRP